MSHKVQNTNDKLMVKADYFKKIKYHLGENSYQRALTFNELAFDWDGDGAQKLSEQSLVKFIEFIEFFDLKNFDGTNSVFMDHDGLLSLALSPSTLKQRHLEITFGDNISIIDLKFNEHVFDNLEDIKLNSFFLI